MTSAATRTISVDPEQIPPIGVEPGGTLIFTNSSTEYPVIELEFVGSNRPAPEDIIHGPNTVTVLFRKAGTYDCKINHTSHSGGRRETGVFRVRACGGC
jgi:hypothetical protein